MYKATRCPYPSYYGKTKEKYANRNRLIPMESMDAMEHDKISELKEESAPSPETCILQADEKKMIQRLSLICLKIQNSDPLILFC